MHIRLWKRRDDGSVALKELSAGQFSDADSYQEAVDHAYSEGFEDELATKDGACITGTEGQT